MKINYLLTILVVLAIYLLVVFLGCEYDVAEPLWEKEAQNPPMPIITQITPENVAEPGVNYITILGENFIDVPYQNGVLFDDFSAEIVEKSETILKVRRPDIVSDSCTVLVVPGGTYTVAETHYKIKPVFEQYGSFLENQQIAVVAVDGVENLYVVETGSRTIYKVSPDGEKTIIGTASRVPTEANFGPDGNLYLLSINRNIDRIDISTGQVSNWTQLPSGRVVKFGDFDENYLYAGQNSGLFIVEFNNPSNVTVTGFYTGEEILTIRVNNGFLYIASREGSQPAKIWKHQILSGSLGLQELVFDMASLDSTLASSLIKAITFSSDGRIFIAVDSANPFLTLDPATSNVDILYKDILPPYCKYFYWGTQNFIYMISGNSSPAQDWSVYKVDIGMTAAP